MRTALLAQSCERKAQAAELKSRACATRGDAGGRQCLSGVMNLSDFYSQDPSEQPVRQPSPRLCASRSFRQSCQRGDLFSNGKIQSDSVISAHCYCYMIIGHVGLTLQRTLRGPLSNRHHDVSAPDARCSHSRGCAAAPAAVSIVASVAGGDILHSAHSHRIRHRAVVAGFALAGQKISHCRPRCLNSRSVRCSTALVRGFLRCTFDRP